MDIDEALEKVGGCRRWHSTMFVLLGFSQFMPTCHQILIVVFAGWEPPHHCSANGQNNKSYAKPFSLTALHSNNNETFLHYEPDEIIYGKCGQINASTQIESKGCA